jgi:hypothetical protein
MYGRKENKNKSQIIKRRNASLGEAKSGGVNKTPPMDLP